MRIVTSAQSWVWYASMQNSNPHQWCASTVYTASLKTLIQEKVGRARDLWTRLKANAGTHTLVLKSILPGPRVFEKVDGEVLDSW